MCKFTEVFHKVSPTYLEELHQAFQDLSASLTRPWMVQRHGDRTKAKVRAEQRQPLRLAA